MVQSAQIVAQTTSHVRRLASAGICPRSRTRMARALARIERWYDGQESTPENRQRALRAAARAAGTLRVRLR